MMSQTLIDPEAQALQRQKQYAAAFMQQNQQPQGQMIGNRFVAPSFTQQLSSAINPLVGAYMLNQADTKQTQLAEAIRQQGDKDLMAYGQAVTPVTGVEAKPEFIPKLQTAMDDQGMPTMGYQAPVEAVPEKKADFVKGMQILRMSKDPENRQLAKMLMADQMKTIVAPEGSTIYRGGIFGSGETIKGSPKKTSDIQNYEYDVANSGFKGTFNEWLTGQKKAGASTQIMNTGKDLAGQVGDISKDSRISAMGAVQTADAANRIIQSVDTGKIFQGAGANQRLTAAQIAEGLGLGGKDTAEKIGNSRQAIQGLAQLTLQGRKQMRGEGAITESEGALAQKAMSGDISLTGPEIRQLAEAAKRTSKFQYGQHQNIINTMKSNPETRGLVPYYDVPADVSIFNPRAVGGQSTTRNEADKIIGGN
jgi:hypothetical protein